MKPTPRGVLIRASELDDKRRRRREEGFVNNTRKGDKNNNNYNDTFWSMVMKEARGKGKKKTKLKIAKPPLLPPERRAKATGEKNKKSNN